MTILKNQWGICNLLLERVFVLRRCKVSVAEGVRLLQLLYTIYGNVN